MGARFIHHDAAWSPPQCLATERRRDVR